jgi:putative aldouronate transport system substrate-binding protein
MLTGLLAGCGGEKSAGGDEASSPQPTVTSTQTADSTPESTGAADPMNPVGQYPIMKEKITVSMMASKDVTQPDDWNDLLVFQRLEELTNVHFDFQVVSGDAFPTQMNVKLASNSYPDVLARGLTTDDEDTYGPAGKFIDLTDLIDQYMPNLQKLWAEIPDFKAAMTTTDGKIYGLGYYFPSSANVPITSFFNETWMHNAGITKVPETTDELYEMLKAFKEKDANGNGDPDDEIPFSYVGVGAFRLYIQPAFTGYTGGSNASGWDIDENGKVIYIPALDTYKDYLEYCNKLYQEGLVDPEFITQNMDQLRAKIKSNLVGMYNMSPTILNGTEVEERDENQICLPPLTSPANSKKVLAAPSSIATPSAVITDKCQYPEAVARYFDLFYASEEDAVENFCGKTLLLGYENEHWKYTDDSKTKYEFIPPITNSDDLNKTVSITMYLPGYVNNMAMQVSNKYMTQKIEESQEKQKPYEVTSFPATARYTKEEADQISLAATDLDNYVTMMEAKFITGEESLENFEAYQTELKKYKLEEIQAIKQTVYDRWVEASK